MPPYIVLTGKVNWEIVTGAGTWVIDKETGKVLDFHPEMPILRSYLTALGAAVDVLQATEGMGGMDGLRAQAAIAVAALAARVEKEPGVIPTAHGPRRAA